MSAMNTLVRSDRVSTGFVVVSTGQVDSQVFLSDNKGAPINFQPLDYHNFNDDSSDELTIHHKMVDRWRDA